MEERVPDTGLTRRQALAAGAVAVAAAPLMAAAAAAPAPKRRIKQSFSSWRR